MTWSYKRLVEVAGTSELGSRVKFNLMPLRTRSIIDSGMTFEVQKSAEGTVLMIGRVNEHRSVL